MENSRIAAVFDEIADILEIQGENPFRIRSYRTAARTVGDFPQPIADLVAGGKDPKDIPGIGESLAEKIKEILASGTCKALVDLRKQLPPHLPDLLRVKGLGPKKVAALWKQRKITSLEELKAAATAGKIRDLEGMGEKTEQNILKGLATLESAKRGGRPYPKGEGISFSRLVSVREILENPSVVPDSPGIYAWFFSEPPLPPEFCGARTVQQGWPVLYIGIAANQSLRDRICERHLRSANVSTLRLSLGCLLRRECGLELRATDENNYNWGAGEGVLTEWMAHHAFVAWYLHGRPESLENDAILKYRPPLNIKGNQNNPFYKVLVDLRKQCKAEARNRRLGRPRPGASASSRPPSGWPLSGGTWNGSWRSAASSRPAVSAGGGRMENSRIAAVFDEIADILEIQGENPFRIRSYRTAARTVGDLPEHISDLVAAGKDPKDIPGIGESLAGKITEILASGTCKALVDLRKQLPPHLPDLLKVKGLGPKKVKALWQQRKITSLEELKAAATAGKIRDLEGMGEKTEQNILKGLVTLEAEAGRISIRQAAEQVASIGRHLEKIEAIRRFEPAGSFRRRRETIGDLDFLIEAADRAKAAEEILKYESVEDIIARGQEKVSVQLASGVQVDFRFVEAGEFGAALMYFTGSKAHNITLRKRAQKDDLKLNEYGLFRGEKRIAGRTEEEVFKALGLAWIPPEMREDRGEIAAAAEGKLPKLIERGDLRGDLHAHTVATDGNNTIEEMVAAARSHGYEYLAITDHSKAVTVAHGLNDAAIRKHADHIREYGESLKGFWLLAGVEVDILKDGRLDLDEKVLGELDWVCASVHSYFEMPEAEMTERIVRAARSGVVHCIGHPFGRLIGKRDAIHFDPEKVFAACKEMGVCLEINSYPDRLDLPDVHCKRAKELGLTMTISTDSHKTGDLELIEFGVGVARRGWLEKGDVLNTLTAAALKKRLAKK